LPDPQEEESAKFAQLTPRPPEAMKAAPAEPQKETSPKKNEKNGEDDFPPFPMGEFLKMFPEARPE
jgi:hypothetical protein